jgi:hypothetical protein
VLDDIESRSRRILLEEGRIIAGGPAGGSRSDRRARLCGAGGGERQGGGPGRYKQ